MHLQTVEARLFSQKKLCAEVREMVHERRLTTCHPPGESSLFSTLPSSLPRETPQRKKGNWPVGPSKGTRRRRRPIGGSHERRGKRGKSEESNNSDNLAGFISHATDRTEKRKRRRETTLGDKDAAVAASGPGPGAGKEERIEWTPRAR